MEYRFQFILFLFSFSVFFSLRPLPHLVQEVETDELMMSWWGFLLKFELQALLTAQDSTPTMEAE